MASERDIGAILQGIENLNKRYDQQELKQEGMGKDIASLQASFARQPYVCLKAMEDKFITKEMFKPIAETHGLVKKSMIVLIVSALGGLATIILYIKGAL
jgi:hypothetical protein